MRMQPRPPREDFSVQMSATGKGVFFDSGRVADYDSATGKWSPWTRLAQDAWVLISDGNARGDVCAQWGGSFGIAGACRTAGTSEWVKHTLQTGSDGYVGGVAVSASGTHALFVWGPPDDKAEAKESLWASVYDFKAGTFSKATRIRLKVDRKRPFPFYVDRCGKGFMLAYSAGRMMGDQGYVLESTFTQVWKPKTGWGAQREVLLAPPGGKPGPVVMQALVSDGRTTAAAFSNQPPADYALPQDDWLIATADASGTFANAQRAGAVTYYPHLAVSGGVVALVGQSFPDGRESPGEFELSVLSKGSVVRQRMTLPTIEGEPSRSLHVGIIGQRMTDGSPGFALVTDLQARLRPGTDSAADMQQVATSVAYIDADGLHVAPLALMGGTYDYIWASPRIAGWGRHALIGYTSDTNTLSAVRTP